MGGTGAKNRRRLIRQHNLPSQDNTDEKPTTTFPSKQPNETEEKFKKPKHLKRKLASLDDEDDRRKAIFNEIQDWERKKAAQTVHQPRPKASQKTIHSVKDGPMKTDGGQNSTNEFSRGKVTASSEEPSERREKAEPRDDNSDMNTKPSRQRGKRRRGRIDTSEQLAAIDAEKDHSLPDLTVTNPHASTAADKHLQGPIKDAKETTRHCIGRKPVTDFVIGQRYDGKVVYIKPFGVFIDIGCHSDAFCHISRLRDDFVESPESVLQPGDAVHARVIEIDRKLKRITVSLQTDAKIADEKLSVEARQERLRKRLEKNSKKDLNGSPKRLASARTSSAPQTSESSTTIEPSEMSPLELKRTRKLARRAARRGEQ